MFRDNQRTPEYKRNKKWVTPFVSGVLFLTAVVYILAVGIPSEKSQQSRRRLTPALVERRGLTAQKAVLTADERRDKCVQRPARVNQPNRILNGKCDWESGEFYPQDLFNYPCNANAGLLLHVAGVCYMFLALAIVCDEFFVPALEEVVEKLNIAPDMAGATFMAAGGSAPELFTAFIGTYSESTVGFGTIVGSAVFNILFVIGCCAVYATEPLNLSAWPLARDVSYYAFSLIVLAWLFGFNSPNKIYTWEACFLIFMYLGYCTVMKYNDTLREMIMPEEVVDNTKTRKGEEGIKIDEQVGKQAYPGHPDMSDEEQNKSNKAPPPPCHKKTIVANNGGFRGLNFRAGLLQMMVADTPIHELAGAYLVNKIHGDVKTTFKEIDKDSDGSIDRNEMRQMLLQLSGPLSEEEFNTCFDKIDGNGDGKISFSEFKTWYVGAEKKIAHQGAILFDKIDNDGSGFIDSKELKGLLEQLGYAVDDDMLNDARTQIGGKDDDGTGKIKRDDFIEWYERALFVEGAGNEFALDLTFPKTCMARINYLVTTPLILLLAFTLPDVRKEKHKKKYAYTFIGSIAWLGIFSFLMVWWATILGDAMGIPSEVMGLTFLAAGTSVPDLLTSVIVAKQGRGDMAVSSSVGSNIFDVLVGLPLPWLFYSITHGKGCVPVGADSLLFSIGVLFIMLIIVISTIKLNSWVMTPTLGYSMFGFYVLFVIQDLLRNCKISPLENCSTMFAWTRV